MMDFALKATNKDGFWIMAPFAGDVRVSKTNNETWRVQLVNFTQTMTLNLRNVTSPTGKTHVQAGEVLGYVDALA